MKSKVVMICMFIAVSIVLFVGLVIVPIREVPIRTLAPMRTNYMRTPIVTATQSGYPVPGTPVPTVNPYP